MRVGESRAAGQERGVGGADAARALDRLDDDRGDVALVAGERSARRRPRRPTAARARGRDTPSGTPGVQATAVSCVPWYARSNLASERRPGEGARRADREHRRLGARVREPDAFDRRQPADDLLGQLDLGLGRRRERRAAADLRLDRGDDLRVGVAEDERRVVAEEVAVLVAVDVPGPDALRRGPCTADTAGCRRSCGSTRRAATRDARSNRAADRGVRARYSSTTSVSPSQWPTE